MDDGSTCHHVLNVHRINGYVNFLSTDFFGSAFTERHREMSLSSIYLIFLLMLHYLYYALLRTLQCPTVTSAVAKLERAAI